jgi:hypothetical protein
MFHIQDRFFKGRGLFSSAAPFWTPNAEVFIKQKLEEKDIYDQRLKD